ncbi:DUF2975 domain-containing protein [Xenorhabdus hominickii]|uniref:DUF2975 domain-containing protein n=1 Tax=Xenorhabdus hominickii TaxID=351679 RepID=A0A2G0Q6V8_XENHO|nr:DUF2975 domain-containing protein [Xenorhabdus hominickii]AOM39310.1 hypothetical protein A9255_00955 [Xenorhabdus hominickii]PHM54948.1 hypothetical protein Xhom_02916 [Xenorhabdus hominickii]
MSASKLTRMTTLSLVMSKLSLLIVFAVIVMNVISWLKPKLVLEKYGLELALTGRILSHFYEDTFSAWTLTGGILISTIPLLSLAGSFWAFYRLFGNYRKGDYFSKTTVKYLEYVGWGVILWSLLDIFCEPLLTLWLTMSAPVGERFISVSLTSGHFVAIFIAACMAIISRILYQACDIYEENKSIL